MTHDELRDYIDKFDCAGMVTEPAVKALRAVVELHRLGLNEGENHCNECYSEYPCKTIANIERQLK